MALRQDVLQYKQAYNKKTSTKFRTSFTLFTLKQSCHIQNHDAAAEFTQADPHCRKVIILGAAICRIPSIY